MATLIISRPLGVPLAFHLCSLHFAIACGAWHWQDARCHSNSSLNQLMIEFKVPLNHLLDRELTHHPLPTGVTQLLAKSRIIE